MDNTARMEFPHCARKGLIRPANAEILQAVPPAITLILHVRHVFPLRWMPRTPPRTAPMVAAWEALLAGATHWWAWKRQPGLHAAQQRSSQDRHPSGQAAHWPVVVWRKPTSHSLQESPLWTLQLAIPPGGWWRRGGFTELSTLSQ
uniref:Uncharacterized protein n=1 Tax=Spironucleus salmonicida TaxID=348837 RepID=V6LFC0_9EUKA|eukprot:EST42396.1 Hypothetical protein SS50377_18039 [Spironucleus salmonicida]